MFLYGNYTSQWFANYYLQNLDHFIKEKLKTPYYIRYMDDMLVFHRNKKELRKIKIEIEEFLKSEHLRLKENWQLFKVDSRPIDFIRL
ncbi:MAG: RNA-directed DNA polymerase [Clostridia bacterium]|nr:RNA-directed DNA polymerase [Clostridia bacterium]